MKTFIVSLNSSFEDASSRFDGEVEANTEDEALRIAERKLGLDVDAGYVAAERYVISKEDSQSFESLYDFD